MKKLVNLMVDYKEYHSNPINVYCHFVGVPLVAFGLFLFLSWFRFIVPDFQITVGMLFFIATILYYLRLDLQIGFYVFMSFGGILVLAEFCARLVFSTSLQIFLVTFILGWIFQFTGHYFEGKRPALLNNLFQIFNAPLFLVCEVLFMRGKRLDLKNAIEERAFDLKAIK